MMAHVTNRNHGPLPGGTGICVRASGRVLSKIGRSVQWSTASPASRSVSLNAKAAIPAYPARIASDLGPKSDDSIACQDSVCVGGAKAVCCSYKRLPWGSSRLHDSCRPTLPGVQAFEGKISKAMMYV